MMVIDTSVWVSFLRGRDDLVRRRMEDLLDTGTVLLTIISRIELIAGCPKKEVPRLSRLLAALPLLIPGQTTWDQAEDWARTGAGKGQHFGFADLIIAALAHERSAMVWSLDRDFERMNRLGWIDLA